MPLWFRPEYLVAVPGLAVLILLWLLGRTPPNDGGDSE